MYLLLENNMLNLVDPMDRSVLHSQPITSIRVWGVGRDNGRLVIIIPTIVFVFFIDHKNTTFHGVKLNVYHVCVCKCYLSEIMEAE